MTARLCVHLLIFLVMTSVSLQYPIPAVNFDVSLAKYPVNQDSKYKEKNYGSLNVRSKREALDDYSGNKINNSPSLKILNTNDNGNDRNKRLQPEDSRSMDQYYEPLGQKTKLVFPIESLNKYDNVVPDHKLSPVNPSEPAKIADKTAKSRRQTQGKTSASLDETQGGQSGEVDGLSLGIAEWGKGDGGNSNELEGESSKDRYTWFAKRIERVEREDSELQDLAEYHHFSSDALDTIKKINPLTIGDQVSQMIHDRKCGPKDKQSNTMFSTALHKDNKAGLLQDNDDMAKLSQQACDNHQSPSAEHKSTASHDYGFSVIILAGDPLKSGGGSGQNESCEKKDNFKNCQKNNGCSSNGKHFFGTSNTNDNFVKSELRVEKIPDANVEFPVYDQDLTVIPDPFHGLLNQNYWVDPAGKHNTALLQGSSLANPHHRIYAREIHRKESKISYKKGGSKGGIKKGNEGVNQKKHKVVEDVNRKADKRKNVDVNGVESKNENKDDNDDEDEGIERLNDDQNESEINVEDSRDEPSSNSSNISADDNQISNKNNKNKSKINRLSGGGDDNEDARSDSTSSKSTDDDDHSQEKNDQNKSKSNQDKIKSSHLNGGDDNGNELLDSTPSKSTDDDDQAQEKKGQNKIKSSHNKSKNNRLNGDNIGNEHVNTKNKSTDDDNHAPDRNEENASDSNHSNDGGDSSGDGTADKSKSTDGDGNNAGNVDWFSELDNNKNESCCISWNGLTYYCQTETTTTEEITTEPPTTEAECGGETQPEEEVGDSNVSSNKTCCKSWREPDSGNSSTPVKVTVQPE